MGDFKQDPILIPVMKKGRPSVVDIYGRPDETWVVEDSNGGEVIHREDGPAEIYYGWRKVWRHLGSIHREGGPAVEYDSGRKEWISHGRRHRVDGPAVTFGGYSNTETFSGYFEFWIDGEEMTLMEFLTHKKVSLTDDEVFDLVTNYGSKSSRIIKGSFL